MGDAAMVLEPADRPAEVTDDVEVSRLRREHARGGGVQRALVEPAGTADAGAGQEMSDGFQALQNSR